ncbi:MAG: hypothetical protein ACTHN5_23480 [Phycisphaerae bacterium]
MSDNHSGGNPHASSAGHQGQDRQPVRNGTRSTTENPDPQEAANASEVKDRSREAKELTQKPDKEGVDYNHPGPDRMEAEKSKGNVHHNQHEHETDMQKKIEGL